MAFLTALAIGAAATMAYGAYEKYEGNKKMEEGQRIQQQGYEVQAQAAKKMHDISVEQAASSVKFAGQNYNINAAGSRQAAAASQRSHDINANIIGLQQEQEGVRRQAMELDARRQQMEIIRNQQRARASALATAQGQGARYGSVVQGAYGQISGQSGVNLMGVQQNLQLGQDMFGLNAQITQQNIANNDLQNLYAQQRAANQTALSQLQYQYARVNAAYQTRQADAQQLSSEGAGIVAQGGGVSAQGQAQSAYGSSLFGMGTSMFSMGTNFNSMFGGIAQATSAAPIASSVYPNNPFNVTGSWY